MSIMWHILGIMGIPIFRMVIMRETWYLITVRWLDIMGKLPLHMMMMKKERVGAASILLVFSGRVIVTLLIERKAGRRVFCRNIFGSF